jgi:RNA polymerase sigma-70 factor (ECF subfamily)
MPAAELLLEGPAEVLAEAPADASWTDAAAAQLRLRALVERHFDGIHSALRRLGVPPAELDDCAQQVFVIASRKLTAIEPGREKAFLLRTAVNVASHARRTQRRRREEPEEGAERQLDPGPSPDEALEQKRLRALLDEALAAMPDELRTVFVLFELEELSTSEIAAVLALPAGTVASRLRRARETFEKIAARLSRRGGRS